MTLPAQGVERRARRDGCDCPPWVIRCAHFDERTLVLTDNRAHWGKDGHHCISNCSDDYAYDVFEVVGYATCTLCPAFQAIDASPSSEWAADLCTDDYGEALGFFIEAEARLLAGDLA